MHKAFESLRLRSFLSCLLLAMLLSACDLWPEELRPLAASISRQVSGETIAWRVGGDVVVINVANSPFYQEAPETLGTVAAGLAAQAIAYCQVPLESVAVTFHAEQIADDPASAREYIFLVRDGRPERVVELDFQD